MHQQHQQQQRRPPPPPPVDPDEDLDLYAALDLDEDATISEIKKSYRKLSIQFHPDKNPDKADEFRKISSAYEILNDPEKKFLYDQGGMSLVKESLAQANHPNQMDSLFGGFFGQQQQSTNKGPDAQMTLRVTLEDLYNGAEKQVSFTRRVVCKNCGPNSKKKNKAKCAECGRCPNEIQMVQRQMGPGFIVQQQEEVPSREKCKSERKELDVVIEKGMKSGESIKFKYMSEQKPKQIPGDVHVALDALRHPVFERMSNADDLFAVVGISLKEALTGFRRVIKHLDGHEVEIDTEEMGNRIIKPAEVIVFEGEGMPQHEVPSQFGNLHVRFDVEFPRSLTSEQIKQLNAILQ